jgi:hypothetical protein
MMDIANMDLLEQVARICSLDSWHYKCLVEQGLQITIFAHKPKDLDNKPIIVRRFGASGDSHPELIEAVNSANGLAAKIAAGY